jgi:hypothetical protein
VSGTESGYGNMVCVRHAGETTTCYAHLSERSVAVNEYVKAGQKIGEVGCTGSCTGPHVHFETRVNGQAQDPRRYINGSAMPGGTCQSTPATLLPGDDSLPSRLKRHSTASSGSLSPPIGSWARSFVSEVYAVSTSLSSVSLPSSSVSTWLNEHLLLRSLRGASVDSG